MVIRNRQHSGESAFNIDVIVAGEKRDLLADRGTKRSQSDKKSDPDTVMIQPIKEPELHVFVVMKPPTRLADCADRGYGKGAFADLPQHIGTLVPDFVDRVVYLIADFEIERVVENPTIFQE